MAETKTAYERAYKWAKEQKRPIVHDGDYICNICGEPWDVWGVKQGGDMDKDEARTFRAGEGCPCCLDNLKSAGVCFFETGRCGYATLKGYKQAGECPYLGECDNCDR